MTTQPPTGKPGAEDTPSSPQRPKTGTPRWVIACGIAAAVLIGTFLVVHLAGGMGGMAMHH